MSKYTVELRYIMDNEKLNPPSASDLALTNILKNYPLENESFIDPNRKDNKTRREVLNEKILSHYYFREIGFETVPRFLFCLQRRLNEIMTKYNQRYKSVDIDVDVLANTDLTETFTHTVEGNGTTTSNGTATNNGTATHDTDNITVDSDTPPTELTDADIKGNKFATKTAHDKNNSVDTSEGSSTSEGEINTTDTRTETYTRTEKGSSKGGGTYAQNIEQWRSVMINIESEIIEELSDLFMNVW